MLLAGASGSGKSRLDRLSGCPRVTLDDFYHDGDHPDLPHTLGIVDWDDIRSWDTEGALAALTALCRTGEAEVPLYDIAQNGRTGLQRISLGASTTFIAEGVFAPQMMPLCRDAGLPVEAIWLDRPAPCPWCSASSVIFESTANPSGSCSAVASPSGGPSPASATEPSPTAASPYRCPKPPPTSADPSILCAFCRRVVHTVTGRQSLGRLGHRNRSLGCAVPPP